MSTTLEAAFLHVGGAADDQLPGEDVAVGREPADDRLEVAGVGRLGRGDEVERPLVLVGLDIRGDGDPTRGVEGVARRLDDVRRRQDHDHHDDDDAAATNRLPVAHQTLAVRGSTTRAGAPASWSGTASPPVSMVGSSSTSVMPGVPCGRFERHQPATAEVNLLVGPRQPSGEHRIRRYGWATLPTTQPYGSAAETRLSQLRF